LLFHLLLVPFVISHTPLRRLLCERNHVLEGSVCCFSVMTAIEFTQPAVDIHLRNCYLLNDSCGRVQCLLLLLGRVALLRRVAAYSRQIFPWTICHSVGLSSVLWKNGGSDPDAVWRHRSDGSSDEAFSGVWGSVHMKGYFWGKFPARYCNQWGLAFAATRPCSQLTLGRLV